MKKKFIILASLFGLALVLVQSIILIRARASAIKETSRQATAQKASLGEHISLHAAGRGNPFVNLADGRDLQSTFRGASGLEQTLESDQTRPTALASADFDQDEVPDLICGYSYADGGTITLHRGNLDTIFPNGSEAQQRRRDAETRGRGDNQQLTADHRPLTTDSSPFLPEARVFDMPESPDFIGAGDFDADGHSDVVAAARGSQALYLLSGDGRGGLRQAQRIDLPGRVTAMVTGEINRRDGLMDVVVGVVAADGPQALVFEGPEGAFGNDEFMRNSPQSAIRNPQSAEVLPMPAEVTALALGQLDNSFEMDMAVAAGSELVIVHGRDRKLSFHDPRQGDVSAVISDQHSFPFEITAMALGDFAWDDQHRTEIAILANDGTIYLIEDRGSKIEVRPWGHGSTSVGVRAPLLVRGKVSSTLTDDLIVLDATNHKLHILSNDAQATILHPRSSILDIGAEPVAVLPMRLNADALNDLVILRKGSSTPTVAMTAPLATVTVNSTTNVADGDTSSISNLMMTPGPDSVISLREAITAANNTAGADMIAFNIPGAGVHTIATASGGLPAITGAVTIDGYTQPGSSANTNPLNAGINAVLLIELNQTSATGLRINAANTTIRGLVINRTIGNITVNASNVTIAGNFIGTNPAGTAAMPGGGIAIQQNSGNNTIIGGPTAADRNLISGDAGGIAVVAGDGALIQGNYIGTDVTGTASLNNITSTQLGVSTSSSGITNTVISGNLISGNRGGGMDIRSDGGGLIQGNLIGTQRDGIGALGNLNFGGISLGSFAGAATRFLVGGTSPGQGNTIAFNQAGGIAINSSNFGNGILGNSIHSNIGGSNFGLGINLSGFFQGPLANDPCDTDGGANLRQNYPVITSAPVAAGNVTISGTLNSTASTTFRIEFFSNVICDPLGNGEGQTFLGFANVTTDPTCNASFGPLVFPVPPGQTVFTATATDPANNTSEFSQCSPVAVGCTITCPQNQTVNTGPGSTQCGATVQYPAPTTGGSCGKVTCTPSSGSFFAKGTTTVNCTTSSGPSCSFTVTVADNTPPTITCPANAKTSTSASCAVVNYPAPTVSDNCSGATASCSPPAGTCFALGTTTVNCTATDASLNQASCTFTVTVNQTICTITCPANQMANTGTGATQCGATVSYPAPTAAQCGTITCSPASGSFFPVGTTTVTCTSSAGPTCTFTVTVNDTQPPTITCPTNIIAVAAPACPAPTATVVTFPPPIATDNCPGVTVACVPPSGSPIPIGTTTVTCTATDASGNTATCSVTIRVFNVCIQDRSNPAAVLAWNTTTGEYAFCCNGSTFTGVGKVRRIGCTYSIEHTPIDRRVTGKVDFTTFRGEGAIQIPTGTTRCTISDNDVRDNDCSCFGGGGVSPF